MKLYHGSLEVVKNPEIREATRALDYGQGFYTTTSYQQAESWVKRRMKEKHSFKGYVNIYEFDFRALTKLNSLLFAKPTDEWIDFVMKNRTQKDFTHSYDIVYGPVANDRVYAAFALYESKVLDKFSLIRELKTYKLVDQYLFHTTDALNFLNFIEAKEVLA